MFREIYFMVFKVLQMDYNANNLQKLKILFCKKYFDI